MSNFEAGYCSAAEYKMYEKDRIREADLTVDALYTMMMLLDRPKEDDRQEDDKDPEAAKFPCRVRRIERLEQATKVAYTILDSDLKPAVEQDAEFDDGYWRIDGTMTISKIPVTVGYLKDYGDGHDLWQELENWLEQPSEAPVEEEQKQEERELTFA